MLKLVTVRGVEGDVDLPLFSNGRTKIDYMAVFNQDLETVLNAVTSATNEGTTNEYADSTFIEKLAYIMNCSAEGKKRKDINQEDFYDWLMKFEAIAFTEKAEEIYGVYSANTKTTAHLKNAPIPPTVK